MNKRLLGAGSNPSLDRRAGRLGNAKRATRAIDPRDRSEREKGKGRGARREAARVTASALVTQGPRLLLRSGRRGEAAIPAQRRVKMTKTGRAPLAFTRGLSIATRSTTPRRGHGRPKPAPPRRAQGTMDTRLSPLC